MSKFFTRDIKYITLIVLIHLAACIETDIYLPAFPDMMDFFETSEEMIQSILSWNFIGICIACPFYGPLSDAFGRRKLLLGALGIFLIASIGTIFAGGIHEMLIYRVLQGFGSGGCFTVGAALIFDVWQGKKAVKMANMLNCIIPIIMALAPMVGGFLNQTYGFRSNFIVIAIFVLVSFVLCLLFLEETLPKEKRQPFILKEKFKDFGRAMSCKRFWIPTAMICMVFAGYLTYVSSIAILFVKHMNVSPTIFPLYQATVLLGFVAGSLSANRVIDAWGMEKVKKIGLTLFFVGAIGFLVSAFIAPTAPNAFQIWMIIFAFGISWTVGPYFTEGMESLPEIKGVTGSLLTSFRLAFTAFTIDLTGRYFNGTIYPLAYVVGGLLLTSVFILLMGKGRPQAIEN